MTFFALIIEMSVFKTKEEANDTDFMPSLWRSLYGKMTNIGTDLQSVKEKYLQL